MDIIDRNSLLFEEKRFFYKIFDSLDWRLVTSYIKNKYNIAIGRQAKFESGDIIPQDNQTAYKVVFSTQIQFSVIISRSGQFLSFGFQNKGKNFAEHAGFAKRRLLEENLIQRKEKELIDEIGASLNWKTVQELFEKEFKIKITITNEATQGEFVSYQDQIAYKFNYSANIKCNLTFDRQGKVLNFSVSNLQPAESRPPDEMDDMRTAEDLIISEEEVDRVSTPSSGIGSM